MIPVLESDLDHPALFAAEDNGSTPVEFVLHALAACLTGGLAAVAVALNIVLAVTLMQFFAHVGIATATGQGLMVPVVHDADRMSILQVASEIARVSDAARDGKATRDELTGSTFTITSSIPRGAVAMALTFSSAGGAKSPRSTLLR